MTDSEPEVRPERTGWRDQALSARHRSWGWNLPITDIDFLVVEYDNGKVTALVEYKHESARPADPKGASYRALVDLGDRAGVAVIGCRYASDFSWFRVAALNDYAKQWIPVRSQMTEHEWVALLYELRGRRMPDSLFPLIDPNELPF